MKKVALITFAVFMVEAIIHYNLGAKSENPQQHLGLPKSKDLMRLAIIVSVFALINAKLIKG